MMYFGGWGWMWIFWIVIIGLVVWGVIALVRHSGSGGGAGATKTPLDIARERYAKGEISAEEFERFKKDLM